MADWHRTPLVKKYRIIKLLHASQRTWGYKYIPQFKKTAKELKMNPMNLVFMWNNRDAIKERAKRKLPESVRNKIDNEVEAKQYLQAQKLLNLYRGKDYSNMPMKDFIKAFKDITDAHIKLVKRI